ncbi:hypothetical protein [Paenibacillus caseinilyticus]|uniref:hypothetical protein n=1 Tax=Paenibacillus caseinilyticus TaxID=3098138 RepID=UPI0022B8A100|nr:hypothetical protein [Paenibacillus caseinilyticus]MCZ8519002.1 hypothetical protein [Paenibacillus caseinilyticus]
MPEAAAVREMAAELRKRYGIARQADCRGAWLKPPPASVCRTAARVGAPQAKQRRSIIHYAQ